MMRPISRSMGLRSRLQRPRELAVKTGWFRSGSRGQNSPTISPMMANTPGCDQRVDPPGAKSHQSALQPQRKDEEEHGALVAAPHGRQLETHGQGAVGVLGPHRPG